MSDTVLSLAEAQRFAEAAFARHRPGTAFALKPLKLAEKLQQAIPFRATASGEALVVKVWAPGEAERAARQAERQATLAPLMAEGAFRVPGVAFFDAELCVMGMEFVPGDSWRDVWQRGGDLGLLHRAGAWTRALHAQSIRPHKFRPAGHISWLERLMREVEVGDRFIHDFNAFCATADALIATKPQVRALPATRAVTHRDLHLDNLIGTDQTLWGVDFENDREDEPLRDVFSLGLDAMVYAPAGTDPHAIWAALRAGYGDTTTAEPARHFLQRGFALGNWARTPQKPSRRQERVLQAAHWILAQGDTLL
ncbi:MAG: phosphotransferase [Paracoccaceae bacterium]|nr:phosphotransferase [Paracoccaceae bacterium]